MLRFDTAKLTLASIVGIFGLIFGFLLHRFLLTFVIISLLGSLYPVGSIEYLDRIPTETRQALVNVPSLGVSAVAVCTSNKQVLYIAPPKYNISICSRSLGNLYIEFSNHSPDAFLSVNYSLVKASIYSILCSLIFLTFAGSVLFFLRRSQQIKSRLNIAVELNNLSKQVAHDIRAPLAAMQVGLGALKEGNLDAAKKLLEGAATRVKGIADDLLMSGSAPDKSNFEHFYASKEIQAIIDEKKATNTNINFSLNLNKDFIVLGDKNYFQRAFSNFLNNSVEAKTEGRDVLIKIVIEENKITITDNGRGMTSEMVEKLLSGTGETTKSYGFGLGFKGAVQLLKTMDLNVDLKSKTGTGTTLTITKV